MRSSHTAVVGRNDSGGMRVRTLCFARLKKQPIAVSGSDEHPEF